MFSQGSGREATGAPGIRTFLIADVRGYTRFTAQRGDDAAARLATRFAEIAREGVEAHGGDVIELRGDEALATFDSPRSAIRAAVELQEEFALETARDPTIPLNVGIGLDAGEAVPVEEGFRGGALNLAARLCANAGPGEVYASQGVIHLARTVDGVRFESVEPLRLKGIDEPVIAMRAVPEVEASVMSSTEPPVGGARQDLPPELDPFTPLVGRERDLRWLRWRWRRTRHGPGHAVFVSGPSGIGKTRLAAELAGEIHAAGYPVVYARCAGPAPAAIEAVRSARSVAVPTLIVVDDLDLAAGTVLDSLDAVVSAAVGSPVLLLATHRDGPSPPLVSALLGRIDAHSSRLQLAPLDADGVRAIARAYAGSVGDPPVDDILTRSGGVPGLVHRIASEWSTEEAARRLGSAADRTATDREGLRAAEAQLAANLIDLQLAQERSRSLDLAHEGIDSVVCPFKGLAAFEASDADYFFGRERLVAEMVARLVGSSFLGVVGPSGSGKSSVVRAGLLPALASGVVPASEGWHLIVMRPGEHPSNELRRVLDPVIKGGRADDPFASSTPGGPLLLVVDQFEELFTACDDEQERVEFVSTLTRLAGRGGPVRIVICVRADFYGRCAAYPNLADVLGANHILVGPMTAEELRRAVELPARRAGLVVEPELAEVLVDETRDEPGGLPLLSTALLELWQRREGRRLTSAAYRETGGVRGAVARLAERAYGGLSPQQQVVARSILLRLAGSEGDAIVRRRADVAEFDTEHGSETSRVLDVFTENRLLTTGDGTIEVAHEALLREWPRLREWLEEDAEGRRLHLHLMQTVMEWDERGRDAADLYRGARLSAAMDWTAAHTVELNERERAFLDESRSASDREADRQRRSNRRLRGLLVGAAAFLVLSLVAGGLAIVEGNRADRESLERRARELAAAADASLSVDPERSILLALEAVDTTRSVDGTVRREAEETLRRAVHASRAIQTIPGTGSSVAIDPHGERIAAPLPDGGLAVWDVTSGDELLRIDDPGEIRSLAFSPDAERLLSADAEGEVRILDPTSGESLRAIETGSGGLLSAVLGPDGETVATMGSDGNAVVWRADGEPDQTFHAFTGPAILFQAELLAFSRDGRRLAVLRPAVDGVSPTEEDVVARVWDLNSGRLSITLRAPGAFPHDVAFSPDGKLIATSDDNPVRLWDATTGELLDSDSGPWSNAYDVEFSPDGAMLAVGAVVGAPVWRVDGGDLIRHLTLSGHTGPVTEVAFGGDGALLASASGDGSVKVWDVSVAGSHEYLTFPTQVFPNGDATWSSDGGLLAGSAFPTGVVRIWDPKTGEERVAFEGHGAGVFGVDLSPDDSRLVTAGLDGTVKVWDARSGKEMYTFDGHVSACPGSGCPVFDAEFSPDGTLIATASADKTARVLAAGTGSELKTLEGHEHNVFGLEWSPDGSQLATASWDGTVRLWDVSTGEVVAMFEAGSALTPLTSVDFDPDGRRLATGGLDGQVRLWDIGTGAELDGWAAEPTGVFDVAFSPDGMRLVTAGFGSITLWDPDTGVRLVELPRVGARVEFNPDGDRLVSQGPPPDDGVRIWVLGIDDLIEAANDHLTRGFTDEECRQYRIEGCTAGS